MFRPPSASPVNSSDATGTAPHYAFTWIQYHNIPFCFWGWRTPPFKIAVEGLSRPPFGLGVTHPPIFKIVGDQPRYGTESYHGAAGSCTAGSCYRKLLQEAARRRCYRKLHGGAAAMTVIRAARLQEAARCTTAGSCKNNEVNGKRQQQQQLRATRSTGSSS